MRGRQSGDTQEAPYAAPTLATPARDGGVCPYPPAPSPVRGGGGEDERRDHLRELEADPANTVARRVRTRMAARELRGRRTDTEKRLWAELRLTKIDGLQFRQQHPVGPYIVDFCCYRVRLIVEIDGDVHETQREYDAERDDYLRNVGYTVLRVPAARVLHDLDAVLTEIRAACSPSPAPGGGGLGGRGSFRRRRQPDDGRGNLSRRQRQCGRGGRSAP
jgi:very-short-patch-repair endonuclease